MSFSEKLMSLFSHEPELVKMGEDMSRHTTFRAGGKAEYFVSPRSASRLAEVILLCRQEGMPYYILGNGSNLLVSDSGFSGVIIDMTSGFESISITGSQVKAEAGVLLSKLASKAREEALTGLEFAAGIPGTLGGAVVMNAGAYGSEMKEVLTSVTVMDRNGKVLRLSKEELELGYRRSIIPEKGYIVLEAELLLQSGNPEEIRERMQELAAKRKEKQPLEYPSAGSTFKRPEGYFAGKLIEDAGLKGYQIGGARVSEKHCGFVINGGGATAKDIMDLCIYVQQKVREQSGVELKMEVKCLGQF